MIRNTLIGLTALLAVALSAPAAAQLASTEEALGEMSIGEKDAKVTITAFESLTCPHCKAFHDGAFKEIQEKYIETGKVRFVFHDFPLDARAFYASLVARCTGPERYPGMIQILYDNQARWAGASGEAFIELLKGYGRLAGLSDKDFEACIENKELIEGLQAMRKVAGERYEIRSTPTFMVGDQRVEGAQPFEVFEKAIEAQLNR